MRHGCYGSGTAAADRPISAAPLPADSECGRAAADPARLLRTVPSQLLRYRPIDTAAADRPISAAPLPADGEGGAAAADRPVGTPDDALALHSDAWPLLIADTTFFNESGLHSGMLS